MNKITNHKDFIYYKKLLEDIITNRITFLFDRTGTLMTENRIFELLENNLQYQYEI